VHSVRLNSTDRNYRERGSVTLIFSVLRYSIFCVHVVYSLQLNCTDSNYRETDLMKC